MRSLLLNALMALLWVVVSGTGTIGSVATGAIVGYLVILVLRRPAAPATWPRLLGRAMLLAGWYVLDAFLAGLRIAWDVVTPRARMCPGVIRVPLRARSDTAIVGIANLVSLSPGTVTIDVSADRRSLFVHFMYIDGSLDDERRTIEQTVERRVLHLLGQDQEVER